MTKITDGTAVAKVFTDEYLNNFCASHGKFMDMLAEQEKKIRDNFTYLGFAWLKGLSEVTSYDRRNEASKLLADDICRYLKETPRIHALVYGGAEEMEVDVRNDEQVAQLLILYLSADSKNAYQDFIAYALHTHRTLQQNLTRFFVEWFQREAHESVLLKRVSMLCGRYRLYMI